MGSTFQTLTIQVTTGADHLDVFEQAVTNSVLRVWSDTISLGSAILNLEYNGIGNTGDTGPTSSNDIIHSLLCLYFKVTLTNLLKIITC